MGIPLLDIKAQHQPISEEIKAAIDRILESGHFILGPEVEALEQEVAQYSQCKYGIGLSSGTDALLVALMAVDIKPGDEVITTPFSFFATAGSISRLGAKPVFVDIQSDSFNLDPKKIEAAISPRTRAILPVHLYGQMAEMDDLMQIAEQYKLFVIEDAAQAIGAEYKERRAGSIGHLGCFSFYPSKNLGGIGDGGMIVTQDAELARRVKQLRNHGSQIKYYHREVGGNFRLDEIQAAVLRVKLKYLDQWTAGRQRNAEIYRRSFAAQSKSLSFQIPIELSDRRHIYNQFVIRVKSVIPSKDISPASSLNRDRLISGLKSAQIGYDIYYPVPLHLQECFTSLGYKAGDFPESESAAQEVLALPIYPELTESQISQVVDALTCSFKLADKEVKPNLN